MRSGAFISASLAAAALTLVGAPLAGAEILVNIDKTTQSMTVTVDGTPRYVWPVSTGKPGYDTPNGVFKANRMDADHLSQEWDNAPMPHTIFFDLHGHAIHGFLDTRRIGTAASHGCVRLAPQNAATLFNLVAGEGMKATTVVVSGHTPPARRELARRGAPVTAATGYPTMITPSGPAAPGAYGEPSGDDGRQAVGPGGPEASAGQPLTLFGTLFGPGPQAGAPQPPAAEQQPRSLFGQPPQLYVRQLPNGQRQYFYAQPPAYQQPAYAPGYSQY